MRAFTDGNGKDSTATVLAAMKAGNQFTFADLYLIGDIENPLSQWLTNYESPLVWSWFKSSAYIGPQLGSYAGTFNPAVIKRGTVGTKLGLEVTTMDLTWSPPPPTLTQSIATASPYQLARIGYYDNWVVKSWRCMMPTPGDANTFGCRELFGGRIEGRSVARGAIKFTVSSFLDIVNQMVPVNVVELTNTPAGFSGGTIPASLAATPKLNVVEGGTTTVIFAQSQAPNFNLVYADHSLQRGYLLFLPGGTLSMYAAAIQDNFHETVGGVIYNQIILFSALPWPPTPGVDSFLISAAAPTGGTIGGFPYVPSASLTPPLL
jgi:hypothetical protein